MCIHVCVFEITTTTTPTIPYYTINPSYCWMLDLKNQDWWVKNGHEAISMHMYAHLTNPFFSGILGWTAFL